MDLLSRAAPSCGASSDKQVRKLQEPRCLLYLDKNSQNREDLIMFSSVQAAREDVYPCTQFGVNRCHTKCDIPWLWDGGNSEVIEPQGTQGHSALFPLIPLLLITISRSVTVNKTSVYYKLLQDYYKITTKYQQKSI